MRLTEVFKAFVAIVAAAGHALTGKVADAIADSIGKPRPGSERTLKGVTFVDREVDAGKLGAGLTELLRSEGLTSDARDLTRAVAAECATRGAVWARQCLASALEVHLIEPLRAAKKAKAA